MKTLILVCGLLLPLISFAQKEILYVGTYSIRESKGIYVFEVNRAKGTLKLIQTIHDLASPTYLEVHPSGKYLYAVNRGGIDGDVNTGSASSFTINQKTGKLTFLNHVSSYGKEPCHISLDRTGDLAFISNYEEGNFVVLQILQDGSLGALSDAKKYNGSSVNKFRQNDPHIHSAIVSRDNRYVYVSDLGTDKIYTYAIDAKNGKITSTDKGVVKVAPGSGPRHFTIHPNGKTAYSSEELTSTVGVFEINPTTGNLKIIQDTVRSLPLLFREVNTSADIHTDPTGKFLYLSNRGHNALSIFSIAPDGKIKLTGHEKTRGETPRNFLVDKKGRYIWVANQNTDNISIFRINPKTGLLTYISQQSKIPSPVCIKQLVLK
ncbi:MAG TPA: lactonase family protein [Ohtaekwangia sp.]|nr:lactonase family protein [Ohtaekwangia sp.]